MSTIRSGNGGNLIPLLGLFLAFILALGGIVTWMVSEHTRLEGAHASKADILRMEADVREIRADVKRLLSETRADRSRP